jgi:hypothetical protein
MAGCELGSGDVVGPYDINPVPRGRGARTTVGVELPMAAKSASRALEPSRITHHT